LKVSCLVESELLGVIKPNQIKLDGDGVCALTKPNEIKVGVEDDGVRGVEPGGALQAVQEILGSLGVVDQYLLSTLQDQLERGSCLGASTVSES